MSWELEFCGAVFSLFTNLFIFLSYLIGAIAKVMCVLGFVLFNSTFFYHYVASLVCAYFIFNPRINSGIAVGILNLFFSRKGWSWGECLFTDYFSYLV